jgi:hypothetical protein
LENDPHEVDYNTLHAKSTLTFPVSDVSLVAEEALPLEEQVIVFQESLSVSEDQQNSVVEEENSSRKKVRVSTVLNFIAKGLTNENGNSIEFSESEDGILKLDLKLGFAKSKD